MGGGHPLPSSGRFAPSLCPPPPPPLKNPGYSTAGSPIEKHIKSKLSFLLVSPPSYLTDLIHAYVPSRSPRSETNICFRSLFYH